MSGWPALTERKPARYRTCLVRAEGMRALEAVMARRSRINSIGQVPGVVKGLEMTAGRKSLRVRSAEAWHNLCT